ncbi:MAG: glycosyltransferase family 8 protein [Candidatus Gastranaerophilales bacterium]|nr:glycosyltransferase family 8 protein [Candidatus Gastranaerophilales bacterium]
MNICLATDDNYSEYAGVVIASILANTKCNNITFYILDGGISGENRTKTEKLKEINPCEIKFIKIDNELFNDYSKIKTHKYINIATFYRLKLASLLEGVDKVLYLDCDVVVNSDISELYNTGISDYYAGGVSDISNQTHHRKPELDEGSLYVNAGMLIFNLNRIREDNIEAKYLEYTRQHFDEIFVGDQQIINVVLQGHIKQIDDGWNVQSSNFVNRSGYAKNPKLVHYIGRQKPWLFGSMNYYKNLYFKYLQLTPWKNTGMEKFKCEIVSQIYSLFRYVVYRPLFLFRPKFYRALYYSYIKR